MPETAFWDTSAFVALGNADDDLHEQAVQVSDGLARQKAHILTTSAVLTEVANTFSKSGWRPVAQQLVESVQQSVAMGVATVVHSVTRAFASDRHFEQAGFERLMQP